jgi:UDP-N-acetylmuramate--alanine ligase
MGVKAHGHRRVLYMPELEAVLTWLRHDLGEGDVLLTLGAGDVWKLAQAFCAA